MRRLLGFNLEFRRESVMACAVVLVAAWLRFGSLDQVEFRWDQAEISKWAMHMAQHGEITWIGPISSTRLDTFPVAIWLLSAPYAISHSPIFATGFVAALNLLVVIGCYFLTRHWFGRMAALVATLLFAVAPWSVIYSRRIWHTPLLPPIVFPYVVTGWYAFVRGRRWAMLAHSASLAALVQIHFSAFPFILLTTLWAMIFWKRVDWRIVPVGALLAALTFVPYFAIDAQDNWRNVRLLAEILETPATTDADAAYATWVNTTGLNLDWLTGPDCYSEFVAVTPNARWLFAVEGGLMIIAGVVGLWQSIRQTRAGIDDSTASALMMLVTWLAMPALFLTRHSRLVAPHYLTTTFPAQFILIGWLVSHVSRLPGRMARIRRWLLVVLMIALAATQAYETHSVLRFVTIHDTPWYGTPIAYEIQAVQTAQRLGREIGAVETIILSEGDEPRRYEMPAVADVLMHDAPHRSVDIRKALVFPATPAVFWATHDMTPGERLLASFSPEVSEARILLREGVRSFRFYGWPGGEPTIPGLQPLPGGPRTWANGAQLVGFRWEGDLRPGDVVHWTLVWRPTRTPHEDVYYHWFNHLLDEQGQMAGQKDGPSLLPAYWRADDTILNWFDFQIPSDVPHGDYTMRVGMYTYPAIENVPLLGSSDSLDGEWMEIGALRLLE